jgi:hypothetical protein
MRYPYRTPVSISAFYQSEGLSPMVYIYIVGGVTIQLAGMTDEAISG